MQVTQMSVTRALVELKRLTDRITTEAGAKFVLRKFGKPTAKVVGNNAPVADVEKLLKANFDSVQSLINRRAKIKSAIVMSNATVLVTVAGKTMTVAEAIELKSSVSLKERLLANMRHQLQTEQTNVDVENAKLEVEINTLLTKMYSSEKGAKATPEQYDAVAIPQQNAKLQSLLDPVDVVKQIKILADEIEAIKSELDFILSESNARTVLDIVE